MYITVHSSSALNTLQALVMGFAWPHIDACSVRCLSHIILKLGSEREKLHPKTTPFSALNIETLQGAKWTIVFSSHPSSFLPPPCIFFFCQMCTRFLLFITLSSPFILCISFSHLGTEEPAVGVAGKALCAWVKQPARWEHTGMCFGAGLSADEQKQYCTGVVPLPPSDGLLGPWFLGQGYNNTRGVLACSFPQPHHICI